MADAPGTCHAVGCPSKGQHPPHGIGAPDDFTPYTDGRCLGFPIVQRWHPALGARCSIAGGQSWFVSDVTEITPAVMATLVDRHRIECTNGSPR